jgi:hypothetical protein
MPNLNIYTVLGLIVVIGVAFYLVDNYVSMSGPFKVIFRVIAVALAIILLVKAVLLLTA